MLEDTWLVFQMITLTERITRQTMHVDYVDQTKYENDNKRDPELAQQHPGLKYPPNAQRQTLYTLLLSPH